LPLIPIDPAATGTAEDSPLVLHLRQIKSWGLTAEQADEIGLTCLTNMQARMQLGRRSSKFWDDTRSATRIPILNRHGNEVGFRIRWHGDPPAPPAVPPAGMSEDEFAKRWRKAHGKYLGPKGVATPVHHPKGIAGLPLGVLCGVEGEMKAERGTRAGTPTLGFAGWHGALIDGILLKDPLDYYVLHPDVHEFVFILDSDANRKATPKDREKHKQAMHAIVSLGAAMLKLAIAHNKKLTYKYLFVPDLKGDTGPKTGLDDYLDAGGTWQALLAEAVELKNEIASPEYFGAAREYGPYIETIGQFWSVKANALQEPRLVEVTLGPREPRAVVDAANGKVRKFQFMSDYLKSEHRFSFPKLDWRPDEPTVLDDGECFNAFTPDYPPAEIDPAALDLIERHLHLFFSRNREQIPMFWAWIAHLHQYPMLVHGILLHFYGSGGSGKTLWAHIMQASLSVTGRNVKPWVSMGGRFDDSLVRSQLTFADEMTYDAPTAERFQSFLRDVTTAPFLRAEAKGVQGYVEYRNCSGKIICQNPGEVSIAAADNRRVWSPDIPRDTANKPDHPCRLAADALGAYFKENRVKVAGTVRALALTQENVLERYAHLQREANVTETRIELAASVNGYAARAQQFLDATPPELEVIKISAMRVRPPYSNLNQHQLDSEWGRMSPYFPPYNGGAVVKVKGDVCRLRILRNIAKWTDKANHTREELNAQLELGDAWLESIQPKFG
jgi:hypothetical protein